MLYLSLRDSSLKLADARIRDLFLKPLGEALDQFQKDRTKIYEEYCDKNEEGKPDIKDSKYHFAPGLLSTINDELKTLLDEEVELSPDPKIKAFIESSNYEPKAGETEIIDIILTKF